MRSKSDDIVKVNDYDAVWKLLEVRYGNKKVQIERHFEEMLSVKPMSCENSKELKALIEIYSQHVSSLKSMDLEINGVAEYFVVYLMTSRLDSETRKYWESFVKKDEIPKFNDIISKLTDRVRILELIEAASKLNLN
jgi:hypothetical protein